MPQPPTLKVNQCTRNSDIVALVLAPPLPHDVIDCYEIAYSTDDQKLMGIEVSYVEVFLTIWLHSSDKTETVFILNIYTTKKINLTWTPSIWMF